MISIGKYFYSGSKRVGYNYELSILTELLYGFPCPPKWMLQ
jgi:hypothetical protein